MEINTFYRHQPGREGGLALNLKTLPAAKFVMAVILIRLRGMIAGHRRKRTSRMIRLQKTVL